MPRREPLSATTLAGGALLAALALLLGLAAYYLPLVGAVLTFVMPLPIVVAYLRYGWRVSVLSTVVADALALMVGGPLVGIFVLYGCAIGLALGYGIGRAWPGGRTVLLSGVVGYVGTLVSLGVSILVLGPHLVGEMFDLTRDMLVKLEEAFMAASPGNDALLAQLERTSALVLGNPWLFLNVSLLLSGFMYAFVWYAVSAPTLSRLGFAVPAVPRAAAVASWQLPQPLGLLCVAGYLGIALYGGLVNPAISESAWVSWLLLLVTLPVMVHGLGLGAFAATSLLPSGPRRAVIFAMVTGAFLVPVSGILFFWAGLADVALDLRRMIGSRMGRALPPTNDVEAVSGGEWRKAGE